MTTRKMGAQRGSVFTEAWLVLLLALGFGGALAGIHVSLSGKIAANKEAEALARIPELVPGSEGARARKVEVGGRPLYEARAAAGDLVGWVIPATGQGFADKVEILIGVDARVTTISGLYVIDQKETPGLGDKIRGEWRQLFVDKRADRKVELVKSAAAGGENAIVAITGATISSETVCTTVNETLRELRPALLERAEGGAKP